METQFEIIARGLQFPEGPVCLGDGSFLVCEMAIGYLTRVLANGALRRLAHLGGSPNGAAIGPDGAAYVCNSGGYNFDPVPHGLRPAAPPHEYSGGRIERVDIATGAFSVLYTHSDKGPLKGPNDIVFDRSGGLWFTDTGRMRERDADLGGVYYARTDGSLCRESAFGLILPNGVGLSPDQTKLYVSETLTARLWEYTVSGPGEIVPGSGRCLYGAGGFQFFDSLAVEAGGVICVATLLNGGITMISPDGEQVEHLPLPDAQTTNICFGGAGRRRAFVTLSEHGFLIAMDWPGAGLALNFSA